MVPAFSFGVSNFSLAICLIIRVVGEGLDPPVGKSDLDRRIFLHLFVFRSVFATFVTPYSGRVKTLPYGLVVCKQLHKSQFVFYFECTRSSKIFVNLPKNVAILLYMWYISKVKRYFEQRSF